MAANHMCIRVHFRFTSKPLLGLKSLQLSQKCQQVTLPDFMLRPNSRNIRKENRAVYRGG